MYPDNASYLALYDEQYFTGARSVSGYGDYAQCRPVLERWAGMVELLMRPASVLDVGCAYGFVLEVFERLGVPAYGVDPSAFALSKVRPTLRDVVKQGALPELPDLAELFPGRESRPGAFDVVLCTEVLEHLPEALAPLALASLAIKTDRLLTCLIMVDGHPTAHDDAGHLCLRSADWWNEQLDHTGLHRRPDLERILSTDKFSITMGWSGRFFVRERVK